jgi:DNA-binding MarR family transcriptional regulator
VLRSRLAGSPVRLVLEQLAGDDEQGVSLSFRSLLGAATRLGGDEPNLQCVCFLFLPTTVSGSNVPYLQACGSKSQSSRATRNGTSSSARPLTNPRLAAHTCNMRTKKQAPVSIPCLCLALRQASRAVSRVYDEELRSTGLRTTQYSVLRLLRAAGEVRQRDLGGVTVHDETTLTRNLRPLVEAGWVAVRTGEDRREKWLKITAGGVAKLERAHPAWERAQERMRSLLPEGAWHNLMAVLPDVARLAAEG